MNSIETNFVYNTYQTIALQFSEKRNKTWTWIQDFLDNQDDNSYIMDLGCGNGRNTMDKRLKFCGVDNCSNFIKMCLDNDMLIHNNYILSDMTNLPFENTILFLCPNEYRSIMF